MEHRTSQHHSGHCGERERDQDQRSQHTISVFWDVEECLRMAHRGHGSVQHQLPALWRAKVLVQLLIHPRTAGQTHVTHCLCFSASLSCTCMSSRP